MATTINAGRVRFVSRGTYNNSTQYYLFDLVDYNGSSYIAKENTLGNLPTNTQYWQLIAEKGNTGSTGQTGPTGATGNGIASITKTGTSGLVDTYTITYTNGNTTTFTVTNGEDGEVTQTEFDKLKAQVTTLKEITSQMPQVSDSGEDVYLADTIKAPFEQFDVKGHTTQESTTGYNIFPSAKAGKQSYGGVTVECDGKGTYKINGASTGLTFTFELEEEVTLPMSVGKGGNGKLYLGNSFENSASEIIFCDEDKNVIDNWVFTPINRTHINYSALGGKVCKYIQISITSGQTINGTLQPMFTNEGDTTREFEPYTGGQPAPSPSYPYPVKSCGENGSINEKIVNKNWLKKPDFTTKTDHGVTFIVNEDGSITANGTATGGTAYFYVEDNIDFKGSKAVYFKCYQGNLQSAFYFVDANGNNTTKYNTDTSGMVVTKLNRRMIYVSNGSTVNNVTIYPILSLTNDLTYVPHAEQTLSFPLAQGQKLMEGDYLEDDGIHHVMGEVVLDGSDDENWYEREGATDYAYAINNQFDAYRAKGISNYSQFIQGGAASSQASECIASANTSTSLNIFTYIITSLEDLRTRLSETPLIVQYLLAEEQIDPYTAEQQRVYDQIKEAYSYKGGTYISSPDEVKPRLKVSALRDLNVLFNN